VDINFFLSMQSIVLGKVRGQDEAVKVCYKYKKLRYLARDCRKGKFERNLNREPDRGGDEEEDIVNETEEGEIKREVEKLS
jgi:hypothetical protein